MATISHTAQRQLAALRADFEAKGRPEAIRNLRQALVAAEAAVDNPSTEARPYPATYRSLERPGIRWIRVHIYWISFRPAQPESTITNVFWDGSDIVGRIARRSPHRST